MLCRCVRQSITKTYPSMTSPITRSRAPLEKECGEKEQEDRSELVREAVEWVPARA